MKKKWDFLPVEENMTVFEMAVSKLTKTAIEIGRADHSLYSSSYDIFIHRVWVDRTSTFGLPPDVFVRALKATYRDVTGKPAPRSPEDNPLPV